MHPPHLHGAPARAGRRVCSAHQAAAVYTAWRPSARVLTPFVPYLIRCWCESRADSLQLWREIQALGYAHSARTVCRFITQLRRAAEAGHPPESQGSPYTRPQGPSARAVSFAMVCPAAKQSHEAQTYVTQLCQMDADIARGTCTSASCSGDGTAAPGP